MRLVDPHAEPGSLLDVTRRLTPEEMAELQLEQGYVDRALHIYEELVAREPSNAGYATRRAWLARMAAVRSVEAAARTLDGVGPPAPPLVRRLAIVNIG